MNIPSVLLCDGYKLDHRRQYPENTISVYSNWTPRMSRIPGVDKVVVFGIQYFIKKYLVEEFNTNFFRRPKDEVIAKFTRRINNYLGPNQVGTKHIEDLHDLGYLPIIIKSLPEGSLCKLRVPMLTITNTQPEFFWITNFLETLMSCVIWKPMTSATISREYYKEFKRHADLTGSPEGFIQWQGHDFSFRGMSGVEDAMASGAGHLLSFTGTDTIPTIDFLEEYYNANSDKELIGGSVPATEHSVMSMGMKDNEFDTFKRLVTEIYPSGIVSIVSDTFDLWQVLTDFLPKLKSEIMTREGRVVIRPDSGDPVDIICGKEISSFYSLIDAEEYFRTYGLNGFDTFSVRDKYYKVKSHPGTLFICDEIKLSAIERGSYELLWDTFGGTINEKGYKVLDPHVGLIYGDAITMDRQKEILARLEAKGFTASNLVLGIGSYTFQMQTRDSLGFALKSTHGQLLENGEIVNREIFKDPVTDSGFKKSARGLVRVNEFGDLEDQVTWEQTNTGLLKTVFCEGHLLVEQSLSEIRERLKSQL